MADTDRDLPTFLDEPVECDHCPHDLWTRHDSAENSKGYMVHCLDCPCFVEGRWTYDQSLTDPQKRGEIFGDLVITQRT